MLGRSEPELLTPPRSKGLRRARQDRPPYEHPQKAALCTYMLSRVFTETLPLALDATAARKYPTLGNRARFERLIEEADGFFLPIEFRGEQVPLARLLYKWVRCERVHEGGHLFPSMETALADAMDNGYRRAVEAQTSNNVVALRP